MLQSWSTYTIIKPSYYATQYNVKSVHLFWLFLGPLWNLDLYHFNCLCDPQNDFLSTGIYGIYGNQKHNYLNVIKAEQLMAGTQLLVSKLLIHPFGTPIIDQHVRQSINLIGFYHFFLRVE